MPTVHDLVIFLVMSNVPKIGSEFCKIFPWTFILPLSLLIIYFACGAAVLFWRSSFPIVVFITQSLNDISLFDGQIENYRFKDLLLIYQNSPKFNVLFFLIHTFHWRFTRNFDKASDMNIFRSVSSIKIGK